MLECFQWWKSWPARADFAIVEAALIVPEPGSEQSRKIVGVLPQTAGGNLLWQSSPPRGDLQSQIAKVVGPKWDLCVQLDLFRFARRCFVPPQKASSFLRLWGSELETIAIVDHFRANDLGCHQRVVGRFCLKMAWLGDGGSGGHFSVYISVLFSCLLFTSGGGISVNRGACSRILVPHLKVY